MEQDKATTSSAHDESVSNSVKSDDIHLSIHMPSGIRLEIKLTKQDVLRKVKTFVDENQGSGVGSYDLSLIYPKRVFTEQGTESSILLDIICLRISLLVFCMLNFCSDKSYLSTHRHNFFSSSLA